MDWEWLFWHASSWFNEWVIVESWWVLFFVKEGEEQCPSYTRVVATRAVAIRDIFSIPISDNVSCIEEIRLEHFIFIGYYKREKERKREEKKKKGGGCIKTIRLFWLVFYMVARFLLVNRYIWDIHYHGTEYNTTPSNTAYLDSRLWFIQDIFRNFSIYHKNRGGHILTI
jgi:hypothetical protein